MDFLYYNASRRKNEKLNRIIADPGHQGAKKNGRFLEGFTPHLTGVYGAINFNMGGETGANGRRFFPVPDGAIGIEAMLSESNPFLSGTRPQGL